MYFRNYGHRMTWLDKCLKSPVSEHRSAVNMLNILTADHKYSLCNTENLQQLIQMYYLGKKKLFQKFLLYFSSLHQILNILKKA